MKTFLLPLFVAVFSLYLLSPNSLRALEQPEVDADFEVQGEYMGYARTLGGMHYGLQVVALGKGSFGGMLYEGGLPGAGWDRVNKWKCEGQRESPADSSIEFQGAPLRVLLKPPAGTRDQWFAAIGESGARRLSVLRKIHRISATQDAAPPEDATVLFDGAPSEHLEKATVTEDGLLNIGFNTAAPVGDFRLHMEFRTPYMPTKRGQARGNSGVYIQRRYELQILDSFGLEGVANECGGLYRQRQPDLNMCLPPLSWQTYDIYFTAARFDDEGNKTAGARITALHNGTAIHDDVEIAGKTGAGKKEGPDPLTILWQNHGNPVHFRNLWIVNSADGLPSEEGNSSPAVSSTPVGPRRRSLRRLLPLNLR